MEQRKRKRCEDEKEKRKEGSSVEEEEEEDRILPEFLGMALPKVSVSDLTDWGETEDVTVLTKKAWARPERNMRHEHTRDSPQKEGMGEELEEGEEEEADADGNTKGSRKEMIRGTMERGMAFNYSELEIYDRPQKGSSYMYWGCLWIEKVDLLEATMVVQNHPSRVTMVDHVDENTVCIRMNTSGPPMIVNEGPTPCIRSAAEVLEPPRPYPKWYHFQHRRNREFVHGEVDWLYGLFPKCRIYLMICIHPLVLVHIMNTKEVGILMERYGKWMKDRSKDAKD